MKKFLLKIGFFLIPAVVIITIYLHVGEQYFFTEEYPMWESKFDYINEIHHAENIILGDSRALAGFRPEMIGDDFYNLSLGGGGPIEAFYILRRYMSKRKVKQVILSFSPMHLEYSKVFFERTLKYNFISNEEINEIMCASWEFDTQFYNEHPRSEPYRNGIEALSVWLKSYLIKWKAFPFYYSDMKGSFAKANKNTQVYNEISMRLGNFDFGQAEFSNGLNEEAAGSQVFIPNVVIDHYLSRILALAIEQGVKVYFISAPFNRSSYENLPDGYVDAYEKYFNELRNKYPAVTWLCDIHYYENDFFGDPSHLNTRGQYRFSEYVRENILACH